MTKVTVIIPTYNSEKTIEHTLDSVFNQTGIGVDFDIEVIVCDDYSKDNTLSLCHKYNVSVIHFMNNSGGPNRGRNTGLDMATGDVVCFLDHDDQWSRDKLISQLQYIPEYDFIYCGLKQKQSGEENLYDRMVNWDHSVCWPYFSSLMVKNVNVDKFEEVKGRHDFDWMLKAVKNRKCKQVSPCVTRNETGENLSQTIEYIRDDYALYMMLILPQARLRLSQSKARYFYKIGLYSESRSIFMHSLFTWENAGYYITSFVPVLARWIVKKYNVYG